MSVTVTGMTSVTRDMEASVTVTGETSVTHDSRTVTLKWTIQGDTPIPVFADQVSSVNGLKSVSRSK